MGLSLTRRYVPSLTLGMLLALHVSCSGDSQPAQEPVAPLDGQTQPMESPPPVADAAAADSGAPQGDAAAGDPNPLSEPAPPPEDPGTAKAEVPKADDAAKVDEAAKSDNEPIGQLTPTEPAPAPDADTLQGAFEDKTPKFEPVAGDDSGKSAGKGHRKHKTKATASGKVVTRYVSAVMLNVRSKPSSKAPVVRRLLGGAEVQVTIKGKWAKLKEGEWVRARFLAAEQTRQVSQSEADSAWQKAHHKGKKSHHRKTTKVPDAAPGDVAPPPAAEPQATPQSP